MKTIGDAVLKFMVPTSKKSMLMLEFEPPIVSTVSLAKALDGHEDEGRFFYHFWRFVDLTYIEQVEVDKSSVSSTGSFEHILYLQGQSTHSEESEKFPEYFETVISSPPHL